MNCTIRKIVPTGNANSKINAGHMKVIFPSKIAGTIVAIQP
jgi:hypothetical protein